MELTEDQRFYDNFLSMSKEMVDTVDCKKYRASFFERIRIAEEKARAGVSEDEDDDPSTNDSDVLRTFCDG